MPRAMLMARYAAYAIRWCISLFHYAIFHYYAVISPFAVIFITLFIFIISSFFTLDYYYFIFIDRYYHYITFSSSPFSSFSFSILFDYFSFFFIDRLRYYARLIITISLPPLIPLLLHFLSLFSLSLFRFFTCFIIRYLLFSMPLIIITLFISIIFFAFAIFFTPIMPLFSIIFRYRCLRLFFWLDLGYYYYYLHYIFFHIDTGHFRCHTFSLSLLESHCMIHYTLDITNITRIRYNSHAFAITCHFITPIDILSLASLIFIFASADISHYFASISHEYCYTLSFSPLFFFTYFSPLLSILTLSLFIDYYFHFHITNIFFQYWYYFTIFITITLTLIIDDILMPLISLIL